MRCWEGLRWCWGGLEGFENLGFGEVLLNWVGEIGGDWPVDGVYNESVTFTLPLLLLSNTASATAAAASYANNICWGLQESQGPMKCYKDKKES